MIEMRFIHFTTLRQAADDMRKRIAGYMAKYPLCQKARVVTIA